MMFSKFLPFESGALNASLIFISIFLIASLILLFAAINMRFATKKKLFQFGFSFLFLSMILTPLLTDLIDLVSSYEKKLERCQAEYVYKKMAGIYTGESCEGLSQSESKDLSKFKTFLIIASVTITVIILSLGVNLLASAISMSQERLVLEELYTRVSEIKTSVDRQTIVVTRFLWAIIIILLAAICLLMFALS